MIIGIIRQFLFAIQNAWADNPDRPVTPIPPWSYDAGEVDDLLRPESTRPVNVHVQRGLVAIGALGPGILGLMADNDAGGMTSYLVTGARHQLLLFIPALLVMAVVTLFIQDMALRVALATRTPFGQLVATRFGSASSQLLAAFLHGLNILVLATEFSGMAMALSLIGVPFVVAVGVALVLVVVLTSFRQYRTLERVLLFIALLNLAFLAALFALPTSSHLESPLSWQGAFGGSTFYLLALAGNAIAPWMVYWQQNAVVARGMKAWEIRRGRFDLGVGVLVQIAMAIVVLWLGASLAGSPAGLFNPLWWMQAEGGKVVAGLFGVGLFDAGLLAAVTISQSSNWMLAQAFRPTSKSPHDRTHHLIRNLLTLLLAAAVVVIPQWSQGFLALFTQALAALMMPMTLWFLGVMANDRKLGRFANNAWQRSVWPVLVGLFLTLAAAAWLS